MFKMLRIVSFSIFAISCARALISCNDTVSKVQLCSVRPHSPSHPDIITPGQKMILEMSLNLISVAEFNDDESTILINIIFGIFWNDTRISLLTPTG